MTLTPVPAALAAIVGNAVPIAEVEEVTLDEAEGRVLARALPALRDQPPFASAAMDGYALRAVDAPAGATLRIIGESAAGRGFAGTLQAGEAVRILTGAPLPDRADSVLMQEHGARAGDTLTVAEAVSPGRHIRPRGLDVTAGELHLAAGRRLHAADLALVATLGHGTVPVFRRPRVALLSTGDELVPPGATPGQNQIIASTHLSVAAIIRQAGGEARWLGIAPDRLAALDAALDTALAWPADVLVTLGGASVGDHDLVQQALTARGMALGFWRIAMRPGKPLMAGALGPLRVVGLPGNPASSFVCATLFLPPLLAAMLHDPTPLADRTRPGRLGRDLPANDGREDYLRARLHHDPERGAVLTPHPMQDSSLTRVLAEADALLIRPPHAPAAPSGAACRYLPLR